jgi:hypothetical protein
VALAACFKFSFLLDITKEKNCFKKETEKLLELS